jgi:hypothetical protein
MPLVKVNASLEHMNMYSATIETVLELSHDSENDPLNFQSFQNFQLNFDSIFRVLRITNPGLLRAKPTRISTPRPEA